MTLPTSLDGQPLPHFDYEPLVCQFNAEGYGILRQVFTPGDVAELDQAAQALLERRDLIETNNLRCRWQDDVETGACVFDAFDPVIDLSEVCGRIAHDRRLLDLVHALYREPGHLFKDKLIFKPPGAKGYGLHQDYIAWPSFPRSFLTVVVAIDRADSASGCIEVFPGYHKRGLLTPADGNYHEVPLDAIDESTGVKLLLEPGDVAFFGGFTPHRSSANRCRHWRRQIYLSYNADSDGGSQRESHYQEFHAWLRERYAEYGRTEVYFT